MGWGGGCGGQGELLLDACRQVGTKFSCKSTGTEQLRPTEPQMLDLGAERLGNDSAWPHTPES